MSAQHTPGPWEAWPIPDDRLKRFAVVCVNTQHCPGTGKQVVARDVRTEADARLIAEAPELRAIGEAHRNGRLEALEKLAKAEAALSEVHSWIVCAGIASAEDMMQNAPRIEEITRPK